MIIEPKNWKSFQHYKDRAPAWIKLHRGLLDDFEFCRLPVASKALAPFLWLLASEYEDGKITASLDELAFRLRMTRGDLADALSPLVQTGFFNASEPLADRQPAAIPEKEREIEEEDIEKRKRETRANALVVSWPSDSGEQFWTLYPNKVGKPKALAKLELCRKRGVVFADIIAGVASYVASKPPDRAWLNPETFLNQERWLDQPAIVSNGRRTLNDAITDQLARLNALDEPAPGGLCDGESSAPLRLLSSG